MSFFEDLEQDLLEAIEMEKGNVPLTERTGMPAKTYYVSENDRVLVERLIEIRKEAKVSQNKLAEMIGIRQQAVSRMEKKEHSPSLRLFCSVVNALGYELQLVKRSV